jgi:hypothetical protein
MNYEKLLKDEIKKSPKSRFYGIYERYIADESLNILGWIKISSYRIHHFHPFNVKVTPKQVKTIVKWMEIAGRDQYEHQTSMKSKYDIENELNDELRGE